MLEQYKDVMDVADLQQALGIGRDNAYALIRSKQIASFRVGRRILISKEAVIRFIEGRKEQGK